MCLKMVRLKTTPALRHCETSHGRYMAGLMQTDVNAEPLSIPGFNCSRGISWNCSHEYVEGALEKLRDTHQKIVLSTMDLAKAGQRTRKLLSNRCLSCDCIFQFLGGSHVNITTPLLHHQVKPSYSGSECPTRSDFGQGPQALAMYSCPMPRPECL